MMTFTRLPEGTYSRSGSVQSELGRLQFQDADGRWWGGWLIEPVSALMARIGGRYSAYRILAVWE
jgi:hypothetical protein